MANPTKEAKKNNSQPVKKNLPIKKFFSKEGIFIGLDKDNFVGVVAYTRVDLIIYTDNRSDDIDESIKKISHHAKYIIDSLKIGVDDVIYTQVNTKYTTGKTFMFQSIYIPFTNVYGKLFAALKRLKNVENEYLNGKASFSFRTKNLMRIIVNPDKSRNKNVFLKGYISSALIPPVYLKDELKAEEKFMLKSNMFISDDIGFTINDIFDINRKELTRNTVSIFGDNSEYKNDGLLYVKSNTENGPKPYIQYYTKDKKDIYHECPKPLEKFEDGVDYYNSYKVPTSTFIPFKRRINLIIYQAETIKENGIVNFYREAFEIGLFFRTFKDDNKYKEDFNDPLGLFIKIRHPEKISTGDIRDLIKDKNGKAILYGADNKGSFDMETFNDEAEILNENFINILEKPAEEQQVVPEEKKEKKSKKKGKEKKKMESNDQNQSTSEPEEVFNDIGSLAEDDIDIDEDGDLTQVHDEEAAEIASESEE